MVAAFYPLAYAAERVGGPSFNVKNLTPPGSEPHDLELTPQEVADALAPYTAEPIAPPPEDEMPRLSPAVLAILNS